MDLPEWFRKAMSKEEADRTMKFLKEAGFPGYLVQHKPDCINGRHCYCVKRMNLLEEMVPACCGCPREQGDDGEVKKPDWDKTKTIGLY